MPTVQDGLNATKGKAKCLFTSITFKLVKVELIVPASHKASLRLRATDTNEERW